MDLDELLRRVDGAVCKGGQTCVGAKERGKLMCPACFWALPANFQSAVAADWRTWRMMDGKMRPNPNTQDRSTFTCAGALDWLTWTYEGAVARWRARDGGQ